MHLRLLRGLANVIAKPRFNIFDSSWRSGEVPADWKRANITPIYKKGEKKKRFGKLQMSQPHLSPLKNYGTGPYGSYLQAWPRRWQVGEANTYLSELNPLPLSAVHCLPCCCFHRDLGGWPYSWRSRQRTHERKSSGFPSSFVTNLPTPLSSGPTFSLSFYLLTYIQYVSTFLLLLMSLADLGSSWALAFLSASLCACVVFQYSPLEACSLFHLSHVPFLHLSSLSSSLFNQAGFLLCQLLFLLRWMDCSCALRRLSLKVSQYSWTPLASKAGSSGILPLPEQVKICSCEVLGLYSATYFLHTP